MSSFKNKEAASLVLDLDSPAVTSKEEAVHSRIAEVLEKAPGVLESVGNYEVVHSCPSSAPFF